LRSVPGTGPPGLARPAIGRGSHAQEFGHAGHLGEAAGVVGPGDRTAVGAARRTRLDTALTDAQPGLAVRRAPGRLRSGLHPAVAAELSEHLDYDHCYTTGHLLHYHLLDDLRGDIDQQAFLREWIAGRQPDDVPPSTAAFIDRHAPAGRGGPLRLTGSAPVAGPGAAAASRHSAWPAPPRRRRGSPRRN
jgi:hypothetical protein